MINKPTFSGNMFVKFAFTYRFFLLIAVLLLTMLGISAHIQYLFSGGPTFFQDSLLFDYRIYERGVQMALSGDNPYGRDIGTSFLYPPPALLLLLPLAGGIQFPLALKVGVVWALNIFLMICILRLWLPRNRPYRWIWYVVAFTWAPFLEHLHVGQVNLLIIFGISLLFLWRKNKPFWAALAWSLVSWFKLVPFIFVLPLVMEKRWRLLAWAMVIQGVLLLMTTVFFGTYIWRNYYDLALWLIQVVPLDSASLTSQLYFALPYGLPRQWYREHLQDFGTILQKVHAFYLLFAIVLSLLLARKNKTDWDIPYIITGLSFPILPNIVWLHHFLFLWPSLLLWWTHKPTRWMALWFGLAFGMTSLGRYFLLLQPAPQYPASTFGLAPYAFVHLSIIYLLCHQLCSKSSYKPT